jgi:lysophospholipase L1-like esterase
LIVNVSSVAIISLLIVAGSTNFLLPVNALGINTTLTNNSFAPAYVAFGDSLTTGSSIATCQDDRAVSPWGCKENPTAAVPYPDRVAQALRLTYSDSPRDYSRSGMASQLGLYRAGIWGYTVAEAVQAQKNGHNSVGNWLPQLEAVKKARQLVSGALGINDMQFSNVGKWAQLYIKPGGDSITPEVQSIIAARQREFSKLFSTLNKAKEQGAKVVVTLYYNPYDSDNPNCADLKEIGNRIVDTLDTELVDRSHQAGFQVADFRRQFSGHGAGSQNPYVFGSDCKIDAVLRTWFLSLIRGTDAQKMIAAKFDPHPNNNGTIAMANAILQEYNNAD